MRVLFNEFPLGADTYNIRYRTGIYRVVEQLARHLALAAASPANDLEVAFHSTSDLWVARRYFQAHLQGAGTRFTAQPWQLPAAKWVDAIRHFCLRTEDDRRSTTRALRWAMTRPQAMAAKVSTRLIRRELRAADIYHSPFQRIPNRVFRHPHLRRFTTVYDVLPITHPEFFEQGPIDTLQGVVGSFREEDFVTCISHATRAQLLECAPRLRPERVFVTHLAAGEWCRREDDASQIARVGASFGLEPGTPYFLSLCTLEPRKNLEAVIRAFARLRNEGQLGHEYRLVLVGNSGWKTEKILAALEEAQHCREAIVLTGFVPDEHLSALYSGALAFVYVSRLEGFGLPPLEAMQCGVPVITSNTSSLPEVIGNAGLMVDPDDLDGLCAYMLRLSRDETLRSELSARSLARAREFSWENFGAQTLAAYRAAMAMS